MCQGIPINEVLPTPSMQSSHIVIEDLIIKMPLTCGHRERSMQTSNTGRMKGAGSVYVYNLLLSLPHIEKLAHKGGAQMSFFTH